MPRSFAGRGLADLNAITQVGPERDRPRLETTPVRQHVLLNPDRPRVTRDGDRLDAADSRRLCRRDPV